MATPEWELDARKTSIFVTVKETYDYIWFCYTLYDADGNELETTDYIAEDQYRFTDLQTGVVYRIRLDWKDAYGNGSHETMSTRTVGIRAWAWTRSNGEATSEMTRVAKDAIDEHGRTSSFSYLIWNDLVNKINECKHAENNRWNDKYATYSESLMTEEDKILTAVRFNSVNYNIDIEEDTTLGVVSIGDIVYGNYFIKLTDALNVWIDSINTNS